MLPLREKDKPIIRKLLSAGCCARCILRFCCVSVQAAYRQPQEVRDIRIQDTLCVPLAVFRLGVFIGVINHPAIFLLTQQTLEELQAFIADEENSKCQDCAAPAPESHDAASSETSEDPPRKRAKLEPSVSATKSEEDAAALVKQKDEESRLCVVCLGILQELCGTIQVKKVCVLDKVYRFHGIIVLQ